MEINKLKELKIEVTYRCPLFCTHCSSDAYPDNPYDMDYQVCCRIISDAHVLGLEKLSFSGGEPLVWSHLCSVVGYASKLGIITSIYTSGNIADRNDTPERIFLELKKQGLSKAIFSIYAPQAGEHEQITRKSGSFERTIESIKYCKSLSITTELHFVATATNYFHLPEICNLTKSLDIRNISILRFVPQGRGSIFSVGLMKNEQNIELIAIIKRMRKEGYSIRTGSPMNVFFLNESPQCLAGIDRMIISPDLRIYPCDAFKQIMAEDIVGTNQDSDLNTTSLINCWVQSPYLQKIRNVLSSPPVGRCAACSSMIKCNTGCLAQKYIAYGILDKSPDPACLMK